MKNCSCCYEQLNKLNAGLCLVREKLSIFLHSYDNLTTLKMIKWTFYYRSSAVGMYWNYSSTDVAQFHGTEFGFFGSFTVFTIFRISNFFGLSTIDWLIDYLRFYVPLDETWLVEMRIWCIKIGIVLGLHFNPWVEASAGGLLVPEGLFSPVAQYFGTCLKIRIWIILSRKKWIL
jgi:hypothetical protein